VPNACEFSPYGDGQGGHQRRRSLQRQALCLCDCATRNGRVIGGGDRSLPEVDGYILAAEIAAVALGVELVADEDAAAMFVVETDNPDVPRVIEQGYRPKQAERIPAALLASVIDFARTQCVAFQHLPRNSTPGLRRAHRLASRRLWQGRRLGSG
jgi:hypothetical protein